MGMPTSLPPPVIQRTTTRQASTVTGINNRDFAQVLKNAVISMINYWKVGRAKLKKAPGLDVDFEITTGTDAGLTPKNLEEWFPNYVVVAYGKTLQIRDRTAGTTILVKDDFTANVTDGRRYGGYYFVADGKEGDKISYLTATLDYDASTSAFTVGKIVTGADSEAKAVIIADAAGTLTLKILSGSFRNDEIITDNNSTPGSATVDGTIAFTWTEITAAPRCEVLEIFENRLAAGNTDASSSEAHFSRSDQFSGVPFSVANDWAVTNTPGDSFKSSLESAGEVVGFGKLGKQAIVFSDEGKLGLRATNVDVSGSGLVQEVIVDFENVDFGATRGIATSSKGNFYVNPVGVFQLISGGQKDVPFTAVDRRLSKPFGYKFTKNYSFEDSDIIIDEDRELLLITARNNSSANNVVLVYHLDKDLAGWTTWQKNISRFMRIDSDIFASSSQETKVFLLDYDLGTDDGLEMYTELILEWNMGNSEELKRATMISMAGELQANSVLEFSVDIFDRQWKKYDRVPLNGNGDTSYSWTTAGVGINLPAMGSGGFGQTAQGGRGIGDGNDLIPARGQRKIALTDALRIRGRWTSFDKAQHELNLLTIMTESRGLARTSNLT